MATLDSDDLTAISGLIDARLAAAETIDVNVVEWMGTAPAVLDVSGYVRVDIEQWRQSIVTFLDGDGMVIVNVNKFNGVAVAAAEVGSGFVQVNVQHCSVIVEANVKLWQDAFPNTLSSGNVTATFSELGNPAALLNPFMTYDTGLTFAGDAVAGSIGKMIADNATAVAIANNAITTAAISDNAITAAKIADNALTSAKISNGAITDAKITVPTFTGIATGVLGMLVQLFRFFIKNRSVNDKDAGHIQAYEADGITPAFTKTVASDAHSDDVGAAS